MNMPYYFNNWIKQKYDKSDFFVGKNCQQYLKSGKQETVYTTFTVETQLKLINVDIHDRQK